MQALSGLTVVTLEHAIAAPFATRQLAALGARVIKIERPGVGAFARGYDQRVRGLASHFVWTKRSKESLTLDVKHPQAAALLLKLMTEKADVVVQNLAPGAAAREALRGTVVEAFAARSRWREVVTPAGPVPSLLPPGSWSDGDPRMDAVPALGQHTDSTLAELGVAADEIAALRTAGAV